MKEVFLILTSCIVCWCPLYGQSSPAWQLLPNAPVASRHNDVFFVTPEMGWIVNGAGEIYRTEDGGESWNRQLHLEDSHFRSVGFIDPLKGWAGNIGEGEFGTSDTTALYQTLDGGTTWTPQNEFTGPKPKGLCGMFVVNDSMVVGVGRVRGPSFFVKSTDGGETWVSKDMSAYAAGLIDVYFFTPESGIAVGLTNVDHEQSSGVVLVTSDGGETWETHFTTSRTGEWGWKISFPSNQVGYVSLQRNSQTPIYFLKTTDGGASWEEKIFYQSYYFVQGIGFIDETTGWIGGNSTYPTLETTDGGETWHSADFGARVNRFRFLGDSLAYAVGREVYKFDRTTSVGITDQRPTVREPFKLYPNFPNPFHPQTTIEYALSEPAPVLLTIFDITGRQRKVLVVKSMQPPGRYRIDWDGTDEFGQKVPSGVYFYSLNTGSNSYTRRMVALK